MVALSSWQSGLAYTLLLNQIALCTRPAWGGFLTAQTQGEQNVRVCSGKQVLKGVLPQMGLPSP